MNGSQSCSEHVALKLHNTMSSHHSGGIIPEGFQSAFGWNQHIVGADHPHVMCCWQPHCQYHLP